MDTTKFKRQQDIELFLRNCKNSCDSISTEIESLKIRLSAEVLKHDERVLYSSDPKEYSSLVFSSVTDLKVHQNDPEITSGMYQIQKISIVNLEKMIKNQHGKKECIQSVGVIFSKHLRDFNIKEEDGPSQLIFEKKGIEIIFREEDIKFSDFHKCIFSDERSFYFVEKTDYEYTKDFILSCIKEVKK